ncbi:MAG: T9SS type A sorting domain-containing protein [Saprospiraceae bacterium]
MTRFTTLSPFLFFILSIFCINSFAQANTDRPRIVKTNWANSMGYPGNESCIIILGDDVLKINLSLAVGDSKMDRYPPLFIEYDLGGILVGRTEKITDGDFSPAIINGYNAFETNLSFVVQFDNMCSGPNPMTNSTEFEYSFRLVSYEEDTDSFEPYPVLANPELFPPYLFPELSDPAYDPSSYEPNYSGTKILCCDPLPNNGGLVQSNDFPTGENNSQALPTKEQTIKLTTEAQSSLQTKRQTVDTYHLFPNPTQHFLNLELIIAKGNFYEIEIIDLTGRVIRNIYKTIDAPGNYMETLDLSNVQQGIYFCKIRSATKTTSLKVLKR